MLDDCGFTQGLTEYTLKLTDQGLEFCLLGRRQLRIHVYYRMGCLGVRSELLRAGNPFLEQVDVVNLFCSSTARLPHSLCDWSYLFQYRVGPLPGCQELTGSCRDQNHHPLARLELPGLGRPVVEALLGALGCNEVFSDEGHDSINSFPHPPYVLDEAAVWGWLILPGFPGDIQKAPGLSSKQQFKGREPCGSLWYLADSKEHVRDHKVPVAPIFGHHPPQHLFKRLVKPFDEAIRLRVVDRSPQLLYLEEPTEVRHHLGHEGCTLVSQDFLWYPDSAGQQKQLSGNVLGIHGTKGNGYRVA